MKITTIDNHVFNVPFNVVFRHASAARASTQNIIVSVTSDCGKTGYGEGCPREYVTGETVESAFTFVDTHNASIVKTVTSVESLREWIDDNTEAIDDNPSAFCALELALLDLLGKVEGKSIEQILSLPPLSGIIHYTAIIGDSPLPVFTWQLFRYLRESFSDFKIKLSGNLKRDQWKIRLLNFLGKRKLHIRFDANNLWNDVEECAAYLRQLSSHAYAIEEPLKADQLDEFQQISTLCKLPIILDESFLRIEQLNNLAPSGSWIINLRISKMGGLIRSQKIAAKAEALGIGLIIGAQVGETSILTRAALSVANSNRSNLIASEGAFGTILLKEDLTIPSISFGKAGALDIAQIMNTKEKGLGLKIKPSSLTPT